MDCGKEHVTCPVYFRDEYIWNVKSPHGLPPSVYNLFINLFIKV